MKSKTIILSSEGSEGRGILTLYMEEDLLKAKLRLYNTPALNAYCKLGVYHKQEVTSANFINKGGQYTTSLVGNFNLDEDFYTAIVDTSLQNKVILSGGTYAGYYFNDNSVFSDVDNTPQTVATHQTNKKTEPETYLENELNNTQNTSSNPQQVEEPSNSALFSFNQTQTKNKQNTQLTENKTQTKNKESTCEEPCANCMYKQYFYSSNPLKAMQQEVIKTPQTNEATQTQPKTNNKTQILESLIPQFNYILSNYPQNTQLNSLLPNSKFVTINNNSESYSLGAIYNQNQIQYICYAVKCNYNTPAPEELGKYYQWLPLNCEDPLSEGYYIVYQDATDLKIIEV